MTTAHPIFPQEDTAFTWASDHVGPTCNELVQESPWSKVYRLRGQSRVAYLKLVTRQGIDALKAAELVHKFFPGVVPQVEATDNGRGALLLREHGGQSLRFALGIRQFRKLLATYANIQARSTSIKELLSGLPLVDCERILDTLLSFLNPDDDRELPDAISVRGSYYLGLEDAAGFYSVFARRLHLLEPFLHRATDLPLTLNHGDLQPVNAAETADGEIVIFDWDDAAIGPAGLSLHMLFNGCTNLFQIADPFYEPEDDNGRRHMQLLAYYIEQLARGGYADEHTLRQALPAAACLGLIRSVLIYGKYPSDDAVYKAEVGEIMRRRLFDLMDLCDLLALDSQEKAAYCEQDYYHSGRFDRAEKILSLYLADHPNDANAHYRLANLLMQTQQWEKAAEAYLSLLVSDSANPAVHNDLGYALLAMGRFREAIHAFEVSMSIDPTYERPRINWENALALLATEEQSRRPNSAPTLALGRAGSDYGFADPASLNLATQMMYQHGTLVVEDAFPRELVADIRELVLNNYVRYFEEKDHDDALEVGHQRYMITLNIEGPLASPVLYRNRFIDALMQRLLGEEYIVGGLNSVVSLPGCRDQRLHKDHPALFRDPGSSMVSPPFAVAMVLPLVDMTMELGPTRVMKGSHLRAEEVPFDLPVQDPILKMGSCLLFDYRLTHQGLANRSNVVRPILVVIFHRPWFRDIVNYHKQQAVIVRDEVFEAMPEDVRKRFQWSRQVAR